MEGLGVTGSWRSAQSSVDDVTVGRNTMLGTMAMMHPNVSEKNSASGQGTPIAMKTPEPTRAEPSNQNEKRLPENTIATFAEHCGHNFCGDERCDCHSCESNLTSFLQCGQITGVAPNVRHER